MDGHEPQLQVQQYGEKKNYSLAHEDNEHNKEQCYDFANKVATNSIRHFLKTITADIWNIIK